MLHRIWQRMGTPPDEIYAKEKGVQAFIYASEIIVIEEEQKAAEEAEKQRNKQRRK